MSKGGPDECWPYHGYIAPKGYGRFSVNRNARMAHRVAYLIAFGPIPEGKIVCHKCDNRRCVNPAHLYVGTDQDNASDREARQRSRAFTQTHCLRGHPLTPDNILKPHYRNPKLRRCKICHNNRCKQSKLRAKQSQSRAIS